MKPDLVKAITKAIAYNENGGAPHPNKTRAGKTGEMASIFQYTPNTWKAYSQEILGREAPLDPNTETHVTAAKVKGWLDRGYSPEQILSMWNAGSGEPNAWKGSFEKNTGSHKAGDSSKGINAQYQVPFDVPGYVKKGMAYVDQFSKEADTPSQQQVQTPQSISDDPRVHQAISTIRGLVSKYANTQNQPTPQQAPPQGGLMGGLIQRGQPSPGA